MWGTVHSYVNSVIDGDAQLASYCGRFFPSDGALVTPQIEGWVALRSKLELLKKIDFPVPVSKINTLVNHHEAVNGILAWCKNCNPRSWASKLRQLRPCRISAHALSNSSHWRTKVTRDGNTHTIVHPYVRRQIPHHSFGITCNFKAISNPVSWLDDALHISLHFTAGMVRMLIRYTSFMRVVS